MKAREKQMKTRMIVIAAVVFLALACFCLWAILASVPSSGERTAPAVLPIRTLRPTYTATDAPIPTVAPIPTNTETVTPEPTVTIQPTTTDTPTLTATPLLTSTPLPTVIIEPTDTPMPIIQPYAEPTQRVCCKYCSAGKACGDSCISGDKVCDEPPGCACDE